MAGFENRLNFSASMEKMLEACPRRLYLHKWRSWQGWWHGKRPPDGGKDAEEAYVAKQMDTSASWAGRLVHQAAEYGLKLAMERRVASIEALRNDMMARAARSIDVGLKQARANDGWPRNPKKTVRLVEIDHGQEIDEDWIRDRVRNRIMVLTADDSAWHGLSMDVNLYTRAIARANSIISVESLQRMFVKDIEVFLKIDLAMRPAKPRSITILDWKTGRPRRSDEDQLELYAAWASTRRYEHIRIALVYLMDDHAEVVVHRLDPKDSMRCAEARVADFKSALEDRFKDGEPVREAFEPTDDPNECRLCPFLHICEREGANPTPLDTGGGP